MTSEAPILQLRNACYRCYYAVAIAHFCFCTDLNFCSDNNHLLKCFPK